MRHPAFKVGLRSLLRESSTYLFLAFVAGIMCLFIVLDGVSRPQRGDIFGKDDRMMIVSNAIAPRYMLPQRYADEIRQGFIPGVERVASITFVPARIAGSRQSVPAMASNPADLLATNIDLVVWSEMAKRWVEDRNGLLVGRDLANQLGLKIGDTMTLTSPAFKAAGGPPEMRLRIRAIYDVRDAAYPAYGVVFHEELVRPAAPNAQQGVNSIMVLLRHRDSAQASSLFIDSKFRKRPVPTRTALREQFVEAFNNQGAGISQLISLYGLAGLLTGAMLLSTFCYYGARRLEGPWRMLDEIGFGRAAVVLRFALTMAALVLAGAAVGVALTLIGTMMFQVAIEQTFPFFAPSVEVGLLLLPTVAGATFLLAVASLAVVAWRPIGVLRQELS
jgi:ABC-type lipoprotein release transport system permease subunit